MYYAVSGINSLIHSVSLASHVSTHLIVHLSAHLCHHHHSHHPSLLHSFTPGSKPTFSTNPSHLNTHTHFFYPWIAFTIMGPDGTYHAFRFTFSSFLSLIFLFVPCGGLSWLHHVSFLLYVKYSISYGMVLYTDYTIYAPSNSTFRWATMLSRNDLSAWKYASPAVLSSSVFLRKKRFIEWYNKSKKHHAISHYFVL